MEKSTTFSHKKQRIQRLIWARKRANWSREKWASVIFSDESRISINGNDGKERVWRRDDQVWLERCLKFTKKPITLHFWGALTAKGIGFMCKIEENVNSVVYQEILENNLLKTMKWYWPKAKDRKQLIFQHDGAPAHRAILTKAWLKRKKIEELPWPRNSPDLNPIENIWSIVKKRVGEKAPFESLDMLWEALQDEWNKIDQFEQELCKNLIESMPSRLAAVVKAGGGSTKY